MIESLEQLRKDADESIQTAIGNNGCFEAVWMRKNAFINDLDAIEREDYEGTTTWYIEDFASHYSLGPEDLTVCKPSTVDDVLRDFAYCCEEGATEQSIDEIIAEYAAKLQIREEYMTQQTGRDVPQTIEGFFLHDYMRQREEIEALKSKVHELEEREAVGGYGCFDTHQVAKCVKVVTAGSYDYKRKGILTEDEIERVLALGDDEFLDWCTQDHRTDGSTGFFDKLRPISVEEHTFQYTLRFVESRSDRTYVTDGTVNKVLVELPEGSEVDQWIDERHRDESVELAMDIARDNLRDALGRLREAE